MLDTRYLRELARKIHSIDCHSIGDCDDCRKDLDWCPKSYADDILDGLRLINDGVAQCERALLNMED